jgi:hypothetical protein
VKIAGRFFYQSHFEVTAQISLRIYFVCLKRGSGRATGAEGGTVCFLQESQLKRTLKRLSLSNGRFQVSEGLQFEADTYATSKYICNVSSQIFHVKIRRFISYQYSKNVFCKITILLEYIFKGELHSLQINAVLPY